MKDQVKKEAEKADAKSRKVASLPRFYPAEGVDVSRHRKIRKAFMSCSSMTKATRIVGE